MFGCFWKCAVRVSVCFLVRAYVFCDFLCAAQCCCLRVSLFVFSRIWSVGLIFFVLSDWYVFVHFTFNQFPISDWGLRFLLTECQTQRCVPSGAAAFSAILGGWAWVLESCFATRMVTTMQQKGRVMMMCSFHFCFTSVFFEMFLQVGQPPTISTASCKYFHNSTAIGAIRWCCGWHGGSSHRQG